MTPIQEGCACAPNVSRRKVLQAGLTAAAALAGSGSASAQATRGSRAIDIHAHYYPQTFLDTIAAEGKPHGVEYDRTPEGFTLKFGGGITGPVPLKMTDLHLRLAEMDQQGISVHALSLSVPMVYWAPADLSHRLASEWNDAADNASQMYPGRFVSFIALPMLYPDRAVEELNRASKLPSTRGVYMGTNIAGRDLDDPLFEPIFAQVEALGLPVFLHPASPLGGQRLASFYLSNLLGNPFETAVAACHLIFGGVLDRHPKLEVSLPHGGGALSLLVGRLDKGAQVRPEITKLNMPKPPSAYLQRFTYDTIIHRKSAMNFLLQEVGAERVMLGSDYCFDMGYERPVQFLDEMGLPGRTRQMILGGNAARLLKL